MIPVYIFKGKYGGINSISFEGKGFDKSPLVLIGMQDDTYFIINVDNNQYIRCVGHFSFISRAVFYCPNEFIIRVVAGSYDGSISITEF